MTRFAPLVLATALAACAPAPATETAPLTPRTAAERDAYFKSIRVGDDWGQPLHVVLTTQNMSNLAHTALDSGRPQAFFARIIAQRWYTPKNPARIADPVPGLAVKIARRQATEREVFAYAAAVGEATFCRGGRVTPNTTAGFSYSSPAAIAAIMSANSGNPTRNGIIPKGVKQSPLPVVSPLHPNEGSYEVRMRCSLWTM